MARAKATTQDSQIQLLVEELKSREYEIALLKEIGDLLTGELNLDKLLRLVADRARQLIEAETLLIPILDTECSNYTYRSGSGKNADEIVGETLPIDFGVCGWVWRHKRPWWRDVLSELDDSEKNKWENEAKNLIIVPLIGKKHFLGGIAGINKTGGGEFNRRDLDLLTLFATQVSIAIENANLFEESEQAKRKALDYQRELQSLNGELADANKHLEHIALHDPLTGLPNRALVLERVQQRIHNARRETKTFAILMMDINRFKEVNDTLGHDVGDELLKGVSSRINGLLREVDTFGRLGGDEFVFVLPGADIEDAVLIADRIKTVLGAPFEINNHNLFVQASFGIVVYPQHGIDVSELLKHADVAMYVAKRGHSDYFVYDPAEDMNSPRRLRQVSELRHAVLENEMALLYQPQVDLASGRVIGVEALARWPYKGVVVSPSEFIPVLEQTGLIREFTTTWLLNTALRQLSEWKRSGIKTSMSVNFSVINFRDPNLPALLSEMMREWQVGEGELIVELTESAFIQDPAHFLETVTRFEAMGVDLSIDDFGTGYSSLSYLKKLPVREIKIDRSFVQDMTRDKDDAVIVESTIDLAHNLGMRVVAEGVETEEILERLLGLGCDVAQGYHIGRPQAAADCLELFLQQRKST